MVRHFIVERDAEPCIWDPANPGQELPRDCVYFGKAIVEMEKHLTGEDIHCYLTWDCDLLPEYGPHVVAILIGEEWGMIPRYARHVRLTARVMSRYPFLGVRRWFPLTQLKVMLTAKYLRNWLFHLRSWWRYRCPPSSWPAPVHDTPMIVHLPWGSASLVEVPMKNMSERSRSYYFSGGVSRGLTFGYRRLIGAPKIEARQALVDAVLALEKKHPSVSKRESVKVHEQKLTGELSDIEDYSKTLMDSKICLAPRGSVADTWRFFEGLKSGCVVITNPLPDEWYYVNAPVIQLEDWDELEEILLPLLKNENRLEEIHLQSLKFWDEVCGEKALGRFLAKAIAASSDREAAFDSQA